MIYRCLSLEKEGVNIYIYLDINDYFSNSTRTSDNQAFRSESCKQGESMLLIEKMNFCYKREG